MKRQSSRKHLLIVDDEQAILLILKNIFLKSDYRISLCNNGENAKKIIEEQGCDLLLTDKNLPDLSGMELLKLAKEHNPFCEVIILTGYDSKQTMIEAIDNSAYAYLLKAEAMDNVFDIQT
ncbi:MAG: response regulator, partial [Myxococcota bacterium]|nr:response regulator [Myxococcota bacterium]